MKHFLKSKLAVIAEVYLLCGFAVSASEATFIPLNPMEMKPIYSHNTPAYQAAKLFLRGVNIGNYLEVAPGQNWGVSISASEFNLIKKEGFDHVRIPVGWQHYVGKDQDFILASTIFSRADFAITNALKNKLAVIIDIHHFDELDREPNTTAQELVKIWEQVAEHYKNFPDSLAFELDNEPHDNATTAVMNRLYAITISVIRKTNPHRTIFIEPGNWGSIDELKALILPPDNNVIVSVHCYAPFLFTHQGTAWLGERTRLTGIVFPGPPAQPLVPGLGLNLSPQTLTWVKQYNTLPVDQNPSSKVAFVSKLKYARQWSDYYGRPVHLGEFGAYTKADVLSRSRFYSTFRHTTEEFKIGWCIWDWSDGFRYWNNAKNQALPGLHEALFGN